MPQIAFRAVALLLLLQAGGAFVSNSYAGQTPERRPGPATVPTGPAREAPPEMDAERTRQGLIDVLQKHPPSVARVLKLDPSLMQNESYLATYPSLRQFLAQHPEIPQNAAYYFETVRGGYQNEWLPRNRREEMVESTLAGLAAFAATGIALGTLVWLVRTVLDQRRWNRLSKIQAEVHSKLMDRFSNNDELLTYVQTPSGKRFLESGPSPLQLQEAPRSIGAPLSRILWSVQIGVVLLVGGLGMLYVSGRTLEEIREFFFICGCLGIALGSGFAVSAAASYALSRKLGLFERPTTDHA